MEKAVAVLAAMAQQAETHRAVILTARTHNVAAQTTTLGKRIAMFAEELHGSMGALQSHLQSYAVRGLKGATGTQLDQLNLFAGDVAKVTALETALRDHLGLPAAHIAVGQVYPRSQDFRTVSALCDLASGPSSFAKTLRLMAGHDLASEGFAPGQTGSSAMPHKMNSRSCERINGFHTILKGYLTMVGGLAGDQWNEGDVSCSVVRRVALPDAFFAIDGLLETTLTVLRQMVVYPAVIARETEHYLPFLLTTTFLMEAVKNGVGREAAHHAIKGHAIAAAQGLKDGTLPHNDLMERLARDATLGFTMSQLESLFKDGAARTGAAGPQIDAIRTQSRAWLAQYPNAATIEPGAIL
jgi:adenylosuccinate lyase